MARKKAEAASLQIDALKQGEITFRIIGTTPMYFNSMSVKAKRTLLMGGGKKTAAQRKEAKHKPYEEFRESVYTQQDHDALLCFPTPGIKGAMATAALETPGITKASVERLIFMPQYRVPIWGKPYLKMDVVRSADINKTPDIRTRAFLPRWCSEVTVRYVMPTLNVHSIASLLVNAGIIIGVGDFRQQKGRGSFGCFSVAHANDMGDLQKDWDEITAENRDVQDVALQDAVPFDEETEDLLRFYDKEMAQRDLELVA